MNLTKIGVIFLLLISVNFAKSQTYTVSLDTTNVSLNRFTPNVIINDSPDDSLSYEIIVYSYENQDTNLVYADTFNYHNPKVLSFDYIDFRYLTDQTFLTLTELNNFPFLVVVNVFNIEGVLIEEIIFDEYE